MICKKCGKTVNVTYQLPDDGIPFYCEYCWKEILKEIEQDVKRTFADVDSLQEGTTPVEKGLEAHTKL